MMNNLKNSIGNLIIQLGEHSVGKCMIPGMFDPKIPQELKDIVQNGKIHFIHNSNEKQPE